MSLLRRSPTRWTKDACLENARAFETRWEWKKSAPGAYASARRHAWLEECAAHMQPERTVQSNEALKKLSRRYDTFEDLTRGDPATTAEIVKRKMVGECFPKSAASLSERPRKWTFEICRKTALRFQTQRDWRKSDPRSYEAARRNDWIARCSEHMLETRTERVKRTGWKRNRYFTKDRLRKIAKKYNTRLEWRESDPRSYARAEQYYVLSDPVATKHMHIPAWPGCHQIDVLGLERIVFASSSDKDLMEEHLTWQLIRRQRAAFLRRFG